MTYEQSFFAAVVGLQFFCLGMCPANFFFYSNIFFGRGERERERGGGGVKIGSICVSP